MPHTGNNGEPRVDSLDRDPVAVARSAFLSGDVERAKRMADKVISTDPLRQDAWIIKGRVTSRPSRSTRTTVRHGSGWPSHIV